MPLVSSLISSGQESSAVNAQTGALTSAINSTNALSSNAINALYSGISGANSTLQPYANLGISGTNNLATALQPGGNLTQQFSFDPTQIATDPGYQFTLSQGVGAVQKAAAANGTLNSGGTQKALAQYASGVASQYENQDYTQALNTFNTNRTANLQNYTLPISIGQTAASQSANNILTGNSQIAQVGVNQSNQLNSLLEQQGNARAAGSIKQGQIWGNFLNSGAVSSAASNLWDALPGDNGVTSAIGAVFGL